MLKNKTSALTWMNFSLIPKSQSQTLFWDTALSMMMQKTGKSCEHDHTGQTGWALKGLCVF